MDGDQKEHWQAVYRTKAPTETSWYQPVPQRSLEWIRASAVPPDSAILDVGGGASTLVDHLLEGGFSDVTVLDIAPASLDGAKTRLGAMADRARWIEADVTAWQPTRRYDLWHDRAVFHFLVDSALRMRYLDVLRVALAPAGQLMIATFGPDGPLRCSGLEVRRYSADELCAELGPSFHLVRSQVETHVTPGGATQQFLHGWWQAEA